MRVRRSRSAPILRTQGEVTVNVDGAVLMLEPVSALMVNLAEEWTPSVDLARLTAEIVDPLDERSDVRTEIRLAMLDLVTHGVLDVEI